ncbi:sensor histidine kinase [Vallicoccus soli]|uniref:histidine kinase n=1 Tax=Vallicoccus soli TaxID=2339232 RepID=A0A3A3YSG2_9ACTN|nr:sensor histidine kinase [Vallicoccus soli]
MRAREDGTGDGEWRRPGPTRAEQRADVILGLLVAAGGQVSLELARSTGVEFGPYPSTAEQTAWVLAVCLPLCVRRRAPLTVLAVVATVFIALQARYVPEGTMTSVALFSALYTAGAWARDRRAGLATRVVVVVAMFCWFGIALSQTAWAEASLDLSGEQRGALPPLTASVAYGLLLNVAYFSAAWVFGDAAWRSARQRAELTAVADELRATRERSERRAVLEERLRIARELHDVVAHHVSVMGVQAGAARRVLDRDPERARETIGLIERSSRAAVEEMRRLLGVLRSEGGVEPAPGLERLPDLVARSAGAVDVELAVVGAPRPVPPSVSVSAYRVVQEALTNVVKHAAARHALVRVRWLADELEVEVVDDGRPTVPTRRRPEGSGLGLVGMRERVGLHDGQLEVGPRPEGGWRVRARFAAPPEGSGGPGTAPAAPAVVP